MKREEVFAVEETVGQEASAEYDDKVFFMDSIVVKENDRFILKKDITDDVKRIINKWNDR
jgi:hypothetical protein